MYRASMDQKLGCVHPNYADAGCAYCVSVLLIPHFELIKFILYQKKAGIKIKLSAGLSWLGSLNAGWYGSARSQTANTASKTRIKQQAVEERTRSSSLLPTAMRATWEGACLERSDRRTPVEKQKCH